jgi:hypothetical protein
MGLSEPNTIKAAQILGKTTLDITNAITFVGTRFTSAVQAAIEAEITAWNTGGVATKTGRIIDKESNKGFRSGDPEERRNQIRQNIAVLLERPDWAESAGSYEFELVR